MGSRLRSAARAIMRGTLSRLPEALAAKTHYLLHHKRWPNLNQPTRFTEKVVRRKLTSRDPRMVPLADKVAVKPLVASRIGKDQIIPTLWSGTHLPSREQRDWPLPFVMKVSNGSGTNLFIRMIDDDTWNMIERTVATWMSETHGRWSGEWVYGEITPRILVEPLIGAGDELPWDYKMFVFDGRVAFIELDTGRERDHNRTLFSPSWEKLDIRFGYPIDPRQIEAPRNLVRMIADAEALGRDWPFVRVDFYDVGEQHYFGEMTFYPDSGKAAFDPDSYDRFYGAMWPDEQAVVALSSARPTSQPPSLNQTRAPVPPRAQSR